MAKLADDQTMYLLSNFTHQVINPLNGVIGTLDNLIDGTVPEQRVEQRLKSARGQLECTVSLVRNLAFFAAYTTDYADIQKAKADKICIIPQLVIEAAQFYQEQAANKRIKIELQNREIQNAVKGNPDLLRQVFMNIFDNGVKYGLPNTMIEISNWIQKKTQGLIIEIKGPSVGFDDTEKIFELGVRGKNAEEVTASGTGLGLHICKLIIEHIFNGSITAQHVPSSHLTKFEIRIPRAFLHEK